MLHPQEKELQVPGAGHQGPRPETPGPLSELQTPALGATVRRRGSCYPALLPCTKTALSIRAGLSGQ